LKPVPAGTSGGVSTVGTIAALLGAGTIAAATVPLSPLLTWCLVAALAGLTGSMIDSLLGAMVQEVRYCALCHAVTEQQIHGVCGTPTIHRRGIPHLDNDAVNLLSTVSAALLTLALVASS
jgi:uncharacterized membrane protein